MDEQSIPGEMRQRRCKRALRMKKEDKLRRERDETIVALSTAQRNLSEAQKAYSRARKDYQKALLALVEYSEAQERARQGSAQ
jgi:hypothetical protein